tara:strand:- start:1893 stop:2138 length:246 start_codon:yes stop_codon:yes gene_type:complete
MKRIISFFIILFLTLSLNVSDLLANQTENELKDNFSNDLRTKNEETYNNDINNRSNESNEDIFGDEQTFPFIAGLGKNAAH